MKFYKYYDFKPMSVNGAWQGRRYKTKKYSAWREQFAWITKGTMHDQFTGEVSIAIYIGGGYRGDIDNVAKSILDGIQDSGLIQNDRQVVQLLISRQINKEKGFEVLILDKRWEDMLQ